MRAGNETTVTTPCPERWSVASWRAVAPDRGPKTRHGERFTKLAPKERRLSRAECLSFCSRQFPFRSISAAPNECPRSGTALRDADAKPNQCRAIRRKKSRKADDENNFAMLHLRYTRLVLNRCHRLEKVPLSSLSHGEVFSGASGWGSISSGLSSTRPH